jgi:hypothetical protein
MTRWLRTRALLDRWFLPVFVVLVLIAASGGWLAYEGHVAPGTTTERRIVSTWTATGSVNHSATVTAANPVYAVGRTHRNRSLYLTGTSPVLDGSVSVVYRASDSGTLDVEATRQTVLRAVEEEDGRTTEVWRQIREAETRSVASVRPGSPVRIPFSVDVNRSANVTERVDETLDSPPGEPQVVVDTTVNLSGTVNGRPVDHTVTYPVRITFEEGAYRVEANATTERFETTRSFEVPREPGVLRRLGGPLLLLAGLVGAGGLVAARLRGRFALTDAERERLDYADDREDFEEWISAIRLPEEAFERPQARADSLGALVDFAIDADRGVVEDPSRGLYCVLADDHLYTYRPPEGSEPAPDGARRGNDPGNGTLPGPLGRLAEAIRGDPDRSTADSTEQERDSDRGPSGDDPD